MATPIKIYWIKTRTNTFGAAVDNSKTDTTSTVTSKKPATYKSWKAHNSKAKGIETWSKTQQSQTSMQFYQTSDLVWYTGLKDKSKKITTTDKKTKKKKTTWSYSYTATKHVIKGYRKKTAGWGTAFSLADYQPASMSITYQDLDIEDDNVGTDVGRDRKTGYITRNRARSNIRTIEIEFPPMKASKVSPLLKKIADPDFPTGNTGYVQINHDDPLTGGSKTTTCYAGDRTLEALPNGWWGSLKITFVEV